MSPHIGEDFLKALVKGLGQLLCAETTFVARALDDPPTRVRGITAWKDGAYKESWEYDLAGNPCQLTYNGEPTFIPCDLAESFPKKKDSGYESYLGIPLAGDFALDIARLCGIRAEAEVRRLIAEDDARVELKRLRETDRRKTEAVQIVTHDLRTPLTSVIGYLSLLDQCDLPDPVDSYAASAMTGAERLLHFINQQLDLEKITAGDPNRETRAIDLIEAASMAAETIAPFAGQWNVGVKIETDGAPARINGDPGHVERLFANLLSNAAKYSPNGGTVVIRTAVNGQRVSVSISDDGPGIPEELQGRVFERFSRAAAEDRQRGGAGLGLSIAQAIVEDHGGHLGFKSSPKTGTTFYFDLPRVD